MADPAKDILIYLVFIIINFILYGFGEASRCVNYSDVEKKAEDGSKSAKKLLRIIDSPKKYVRTVHVMTIAMAMVVGHHHVSNYMPKVEMFLVEKLSLSMYLTDAFIVFLSYMAVGIYLMLLILSIGVIVPKNFGKKYCMAMSVGLVNVVGVIMFVLTPITGLINFFANLILRVVGIDPKGFEDNVTEEEIVSIVNEGHEQGVLMASEAEMINNIIELDEKEAADIMIHRKNIIALDGETTLRDCVEFILQQRFSRFPVYMENIDNIIGIMHLRDAMVFSKQEGMEDKRICDIPKLIREADFIPETRNVDTLFKEMQSNKTHMVIVVDEYGQTAGLVAMEDIIEEIVGNILDEYDEEENNIVEESEDVYIIKGSTTLEELEDRFEIKFDEEDFDTINGYLIAKLDRIPEEDDKPVCEISGNTYEVLSIKNKMIENIRMTLSKKTEEESEEEA